ncbi:MAG TPA: hypothetical protein VII49_03540 [Rhizomicrobium sp.]
MALPLDIDDVLGEFGEPVCAIAGADKAKTSVAAIEAVVTNFMQTPVIW